MALACMAHPPAFYMFFILWREYSTGERKWLWHAWPIHLSSTCFLFYGASTAQVRGNGFGLVHPPVLPFSFLEMKYVSCSTFFILWREYSTGERKRLWHGPSTCLTISFLRAMGEAMKETPVEENNGYVVSK